MNNWEQIGWLIAYTISGLVLSVPYLLLAGWSWEHWPLAAFFTPALAIFWLLLGILSGALRIGRHRDFGAKWMFPPAMFWIMTTYLALPILLNSVAKLLNFIGYADIGNVIFEHRFAVLPAVLLVSIAALVVLGAAASALESVREWFNEPNA